MNNRTWEINNSFGILDFNSLWSRLEIDLKLVLAQFGGILADQQDKQRELNLISKAKAGDTEAFGLLIDQHKQRIYAVAFQMMHNHADADEMTQRAFVKAFQSIHKFKEQSSFFTWLYRITINLCIDHFRKQKHHVSLSETPSDEGSHKNELSEKSQVDQKMMKQETQDMVWSALRKLKEDVRATVVTVYLQGIPPKEAASALGCAEATVHWRLHRARPLLKKILSNQMREG